MQFGLCILQDCSYVLCPFWKNIAQTAKNTICDVTQKVNVRGHVTNLRWPYDGPMMALHLSGCDLTFRLCALICWTKSLDDAMLESLVPRFPLNFPQHKNGGSWCD